MAEGRGRGWYQPDVLCGLGFHIAKLIIILIFHTIFSYYCINKMYLCENKLLNLRIMPLEKIIGIISLIGLFLYLHSPFIAALFLRRSTKSKQRPVTDDTTKNNGDKAPFRGDIKTEDNAGGENCGIKSINCLGVHCILVFSPKKVQIDCKSSQTHADQNKSKPCTDDNLRE